MVWSFQEILADLRNTKIRNSLPLPAEILHGRNLKEVTVVLGPSYKRDNSNTVSLMTRTTGSSSREHWCGEKGIG